MKILILANNVENVQKIKNDIEKIEQYHHEHHWPSLQIGDLSSHHIHEISDLVSCDWVDRKGEEGGTTTIKWKTDNV